MIKSPIFYMGNKYEMLKVLLRYFPNKKDVKLFVDLFGGSGVVSANVSYDNVVYNEINKNIVELVKLFKNYEPNELTNHIEKRIKEFNMVNKSMDVRQNGFDEKDLVEARKAYIYFRKWYNNSKKDYKDLFTLTHFSFCNLIRFNSNSDFNMPFGNRCYLKDKHAENIKMFSEAIIKKDVDIVQNDAIEYLKKIKSNVNQFIYLDPPYTNTTAIYNEKRAFGGWGLDNDIILMKELDRLDRLGVMWAMSNVLKNKGKENKHLKTWAKEKGYEIIYIDEKQYSALGKGNAKTQEVLIVNYETPYKQYNLFEGVEQ